MVEELDTRKVQRVGGTSLSVSLPKRWTEMVGLEPGDEVRFQDNEDGTLTLHRQGGTDTTPVTYSIDADACSPSLLNRVVVACYILGYETIVIQGDTALSRPKLEAIHAVTDRLNGLSIVQQEESRLELHNFMDVTSSSVYTLMRRIRTTVLHMLDSCMYALLQQRGDLIEEVRAMEDDLDVLYWLVLRQLLSAADDREMMDDVGVTSPLHVIGNRTAVKSLEGIADCIEDCALQVKMVLETGEEPGQEQQEALSALTEALHDRIDTATDSLLEQDATAANDVMDAGRTLQDRGERFLAAIEDGFEDEDAIRACHRIVWNTERIADYCEFLAEIALNRVMESANDFGTLETGEKRV